MDHAVEARAKVIWGHEPERVHDYLRDNGYSRTEADELLEELFEERYDLIRKRGIKRIIIGGFVSFVCLSFIFLLFLERISFSSSPRGGGGIGIIALLGLWGGSKLIDGLFDYRKPERCRKSLSTDNHEF